MAESAPVRTREFPATGLQRTMIMASLHPETRSAYHQQLVVDLSEPLDVRLFQDAVRHGMQRHAGLSARFHLRNSTVYQCKAEEAGGAFTVQDFSDSGQPRERLVEAVLKNDRASPFDPFENAPLWRSTLLLFSHHDHCWVWSHHHALCDASCYPLLLRELYDIYDQLLEGQVMEKQPARPDFLDHLQWLDAQKHDQQRDAWKSLLSHSTGFTQLPSNEPRETENRLRRQTLGISSKLETELRHLARNCDVTLNTIITAAWALCLSRATGDFYPTFGIMRAARKSSVPGSESIIGPLVNTLPFCVAADGDVPVVDFLRQVRAAWIAQRPLEHCPLASIARWMEWDAIESAVPSVVNFKRARLDHQLHESGLPPPRCNAQLHQQNTIPLLVNAHESPCLEVEVVWQTHRVSQTVAEAAVHGLTNVLQQFASTPSIPICKIGIHGSEINRPAPGPTPPQPPDVSPFAHARIEQHITNRPGHVAMEHQGRIWTYADLDKCAEKVAGKLHSQGSVIATVLPSAPEIVCCMLGALRAGCPFFLLNPDSPAEERNEMLQRLGVQTLIHHDNATPGTGGSVDRSFSFQSIVEASPPPPASRPNIAPDAPAYYVHTSGSTGVKKLVGISHHALANALSSLVDLYQLVPGDRRLSRATPGNDFFIAEILVTLSAGATVVFCESSGTLSLTEYLDEMDGKKITVTGIPASYWHEWVRAMDVAKPPALPGCLRLVITGMERINPALLRKWRQILGTRLRWLNVYGPAETTLVATAYEPGHEAESTEHHVPIGKPLPNTAIYILDEAQRRLPAGIPGEIYIAGRGVGIGYHGDPDATNHRFLSNPFTTSPYFQRMYRTGDFGYLALDGQFVFTGRKDQQVKIRGHRVEPGEVENQLAQYPGIKQVVVTAEGPDDQRRLVAFLVGCESANIPSIREWLRCRVSAHLVPADFICLESIPMMSTGKIDLQRLSAIASSPPAAASSDKLFAHYFPYFLRKLWIEILGDRNYSPDDNFFDVGGNSLNAVRLLTQIEKRLHVPLSIHDLFNYPTIATMAQRLLNHTTAEGCRSLVKMSRASEGRPLCLVHGWGGDVFHFIQFSRRLSDSRPVFGLHGIEHSGGERPICFEAMAGRYAEEIQRAIPPGPVDLFGYSAGGMAAFATACALESAGREIGTLFIVDTMPSNLPMPVHVRVVVPVLLDEIQKAVRALHQKPLRLWREHFLSHLQRCSDILGQGGKPNAEKAVLPVPEDGDYYVQIGTQYVPRPQGFDVHLMTSRNQRLRLDAAWRFLAHGRFTTASIDADHHDIFLPGHVDKIVDTFSRYDSSHRNSKT